MAFWDLVFNWWRHRREERQDTRDQSRLAREGRQELRGLYADLVDAAPDELQKIAVKRRFHATLEFIARAESELFADKSPAGLGSEPGKDLIAADSGLDRSALSDILERLIAAGQSDEALAVVRLVEGIVPEDQIDLVLGAIDALRALNRIDEALEETERLVLAGYPRWRALRVEALLHMATGELEKAVSAANAIIDEEGEEASGLALRGYIEVRQQHHDAALESIAAACELRPESQYFKDIRLEITSRVDPAQAKVLADEILAVNPEHVQALRGRAEWFLERDQLDNALMDAAHLVNIEPDDPAHHVLKARVLEFAGEYDAALQEIALADRIEPNDPHTIWHKIGPILRMSPSDPASATERTLTLLSLLSVVIAHADTTPKMRASAHATRALELVRQGAKELADADLQKAKDLGPPEYALGGLIEAVETLSSALAQSQR